MPKLSQRGTIIILFSFLLFFFALLFLGTVTISKQVFEKIRIQETLNEAVLVGAGFLTETLNQIALLNKEVHQLFLDRKEDFLWKGSKRNEHEARRQLEETMRQQDFLRDRMEHLAEEAYPKAYALAAEVIRKELPEADVIPLYREPLVLRDGLYEELPFAKIKGNVFDPSGHQTIPKNGYPLRMAFEKEPQSLNAIGIHLTLPPSPELPAFLRSDRPYQAMAAAQPFGGSLWGYALGDKDRLYQTALIPTENLNETRR